MTARSAITIVLQSLCGVAIAALSSATISAPAADPPDTVAFFETRIRPVLVQHCYQCHSDQADEIGGSLRLDSSDAMMIGGDSGPSISPGDVQGSLLVSALRYESSEMPPSGKLPAEVIEDFEQWIAAGAIDPRTAAAPIPAHTPEIDFQQGRRFWAFQPLAAPTTPPPSTLSSGGPIDQFVNQRLLDAAIEPNPAAPPAVRLRRLAFDLTGLPPSPQLQQRWLADPSPQHWRRIVDQLLASPGFAEHWARHWMDVARYADSNGSDFNATHHEAWRYRQYLIDSFAADRPFDQMIRQQVAGDLLPAETDQQRHDNVVASTFLMLGTKMLSERDKAKLTLDVVDEQIDTVGRAFLGLTLGCARCHDHKFDPVSTEDYYALAGIFKSTVSLNGESQKYVSTWNRVPLPTTAQHRAALQQHQSDVAALQQQLKLAEQELAAAKQHSQSQHAGVVVDDADAEKQGSWKPSTYVKQFVGEGYVHDDNSGKGESTIRYTAALPHTGSYEVRLSFAPGANRASKIPVTIATGAGEVSVMADQRRVTLQPMWLSLGHFDFVAQRDAVVTISNAGTSGYVIADAVQFLPRDQTVATADPQLADSGSADSGPSQLVAATAHRDRLKTALAELKKSAPPPVPEAMAPADLPSDQIADSPVHIRGEVKNLGNVVPRGFLTVCTSGDAAIEQPRGSGRLDLADWLTDPDNPLVARVFVNRVWMHLFGEGLVRTVDNFGVQGQRPTHPELLDKLAADFVRGGWQIKPLIRQIVNTAAYARSSQYDPLAMAVDPENRLLWRMHRRRLPAESIRDTMLMAADQLDRRSRLDPMSDRGTLVSSNNGDSTAKFDDIAQPCRSVYLPVMRGYMPPMLTALDVADPDLLVGKRPTTNVPGQALVLINSPEVNDWARATADRVVQHADHFDLRLEYAYRICVHRFPDDEDRRIASDFFARVGDNADSWQQFLAALFAGTEFRLLD